MKVGAVEVKGLAGSLLPFTAVASVILYFAQDAWGGIRFLTFFVAFNLLPAAALLEALAPQWRARRAPSLLLVGLGPSACVLTLFPAWVMGIQFAYYLVPPICLAFLATRKNVRTGFFEIGRSGTLVTWTAIVLATFIAVAPATLAPLNPHLIHQAAFSAKLLQGFPPDLPFVAGLPFAYNYLAHLWIAQASYLTSISVADLVAYAGPSLLILSCAAAVAGALLLSGTAGWTAAAVVMCVFWYSGWSSVGTHLLARSIGWSSIILIGPLMAFPAALAVALAASNLRSARAVVLIFLMTVVVVGSRAPGALVVLCAIGWLLTVKFVFQRRFDSFLLASLVAATAATAIGFYFFLGYGTGYSLSSFTEINLTPFEYLTRVDFFWLPAKLVAIGVSVTAAGVLQFLAIALLQAGFLTPFLLWRLIVNRAPMSDLEVFLSGMSLAGIGAVFFTEAPGGSHFTFLHYTTIAMSMWGGLALSLAWHSTSRRALGGMTAIALPLFALQAAELPFAAVPGMATFAGQRDARFCDGERVPLVSMTLPPGANIVMPLSAGTYCERVRVIIENPSVNAYVEESLSMLAEFDTSRRDELQRMAALLRKSPQALARTLPEPRFVVGPGMQLEQIGN